MHRFFYKFQAFLSAYLCNWITADQTISLYFVVRGGGEGV
jgi:hypothetical protein